MYFDTHAHYDARRFAPDRDQVLESLAGEGISLVLNPGADYKSSQRAVSLAEKYPFVYAAVGTHPHEAAAMKPQDIDAFRKWAQHPKVVAIGEMGLDYYYDHSPREVQKAKFIQQMELAQEVNLPVIIHQRDAPEDTLNILRAFPGTQGVIHCFSGSLETAKAMLDLGYHLSFTGVVTFPNARKSHEVLHYMPDDRLLLETDAPYMAPVPHRGKRCDSRYLPYIAETVAEIWGMSTQEVAQITTENGKRLFGID